MRQLIALFMLVVCLPVAYAQSPAVFDFSRQNKLRYVEAKVLMPASLAQVTVPTVPTGGDVQILYMALSNPGAATTVTIQDGDGSTYAMFTAVPIGANTTYVVPLPMYGLKFKGGIFVQSTSGTVVIRLSGASK